MLKSKYLVATILTATCALSWNGTASAATACPASVGTPLGSATASVDIVINPGNTLTITDPSSGSAIFDQPPTEDTLFFVTNSSGAAVTSISLTSPTLPIFGFDGDGSFSNANGALNNYEGPGVTFSGISGNFRTGTVNFTGGLADGASTFFGLEENVPASQISAVPGPIVGAGLPGLIMAGGGILGWWRRKRKAHVAA